jgi:hypothetical protein
MNSASSSSVQHTSWPKIQYLASASDSRFVMRALVKCKNMLKSSTSFSQVESEIVTKHCRDVGMALELCLSLSGLHEYALRDKNMIESSIRSKSELTKIGHPQLLKPSARDRRGRTSVTIRPEKTSYAFRSSTPCLSLCSPTNTYHLSSHSSFMNPSTFENTTALS